MSSSKKTLKGKARADIGMYLLEQMMPDYYTVAFDHMDITIEDEPQFEADFDATLDYLRKQLKEMSK